MRYVDGEPVTEERPVPGRYDLSLYRGDTFRLPLRLTYNAAQPGEEANYQPVDLTEHTDMLAQIRSKPNEGIIGEFDIFVTEVLDGRVSLELPAELTATFDFKRAYWDFQTISGTFGTRTWLKGEVTLTLDVSRPEAAAP